MKSGFKKWASGLIVTAALAGSVAFTGCEQTYVCGVFDAYTERYCGRSLKRNAPFCSYHTAKHAKWMRDLDRAFGK